MLNAMRMLPPDATHTLLICFTPNKGKIVSPYFNTFTGNTSKTHIPFQAVLAVCHKSYESVILFRPPYLLKLSYIANATISFQFQEVLDVETGTSCLYITLKGRGVSPVVNLSVSESLMDMGTVIAAEYREDTFKVHLIHLPDQASIIQLKHKIIIYH